MKIANNRALVAEKKKYNQPIVEIESAMFACQAICTSPGTGISGGGSTGSGDPNLPGGTDPIPGS